MEAGLLGGDIEPIEPDARGHPEGTLSANRTPASDAWNVTSIVFIWGRPWALATAKPTEIDACSGDPETLG
jgi:hypothetical protein